MTHPPPRWQFTAEDYTRWAISLTASFPIMAHMLTEAAARLMEPKQTEALCKAEAEAAALRAEVQLVTGAILSRPWRMNRHDEACCQWCDGEVVVFTDNNHPGLQADEEGYRHEDGCLWLQLATARPSAEAEVARLTAERAVPLVLPPHDGLRPIVPPESGDD